MEYRECDRKLIIPSPEYVRDKKCMSACDAYIKIWSRGVYVS